MKNNRDGMEYEDVEPDFNYHKEEQSERLIDDISDLLALGVDKLRQGGNGVIQHLMENQMTYIVLMFLISIWLSGWFANSGDAFLSLLSVVLGVVLSIGFSLINGRSK